eukprot:TRINITY_DN15212_c0_g1_i1.p1 TRINITY_DN15212_c0_g1~~TRINITY_DN15212_c0_g1_i1.p1  ORF type:complete len:392 (-),score=69.77 TRINITY_DN15212_c0_g1_i1:254-1387(-)
MADTITPSAFKASMREDALAALKTTLTLDERLAKAREVPLTPIQYASEDLSTIKIAGVTSFGMPISFDTATFLSNGTAQWAEGLLRLFLLRRHLVGLDLDKDVPLFRVQVLGVKGEDLLASDQNGFSDPYAEIACVSRRRLEGSSTTWAKRSSQYGPERWEQLVKTPVLKKTMWAEWIHTNEEGVPQETIHPQDGSKFDKRKIAYCPLPELECCFDDVLTFTLMDMDRFTSDDRLGSQNVDMAALAVGHWIDACAHGVQPDAIKDHSWEVTLQCKNRDTRWGKLKKGSFEGEWEEVAYPDGSPWHTTIQDSGITLKLRVTPERAGLWPSVTESHTNADFKRLIKETSWLPDEFWDAINQEECSEQYLLEEDLQSLNL